MGWNQCSGGAIDKACAKWAKTIPLGGDDNARMQWKNCNVYFIGRTIYSYGAHFPMGYVIAENLVWVNGDRYDMGGRFSPSTDNHLASVRSAIRVHAPEATVVVVSRRALTAAGIENYGTIRPVHGRGMEYTKHVDTKPPAGMDTAMHETVKVRDYSQQPTYKADNRHGRRYVYPTVTRVRDIHAGYGDQLNNWDTSTASFDDVVGTVTTGDRQLVRWHRGTYHWHTGRYWREDAVFTAEDRYGRHAYYVSSFDEQEGGRHYLKRLPAAAATVDEAIELLIPEAVKAARDAGAQIVRQGDVYAIETDMSTRELRKLGAEFEKRTIHLTPQAARNQFTRNALRKLGNTHHDWCDQWAADAFADMLIIKFCELYPDAEVPTRQGVHELRNWKADASDKSVTAAKLAGTAHTATEVATLPDGRQYVRGIMYYEPTITPSGWRSNGYRRQSLGKSWHLIASNYPESVRDTTQRAA